MWTKDSSLVKFWAGWVNRGLFKKEQIPNLGGEFVALVESLLTKTETKK